MRSTLALLKPKALAFRNQFRKRSEASTRGQTIAVAGFSLIIMVGLFCGTTWSLVQLNKFPFLIYVPPSLPLSLILMMLLIMTTITALASALGTFYLADDLEIILAAPIPSTAFFLSRLTYVLCTIAWMPLVFILPVLLAMGLFYDLSPWFVPIALLALLPFFLVPASVGALIATLFMTLFTHRWAKIIVRVGIIGILCTVLILVNSLVGDLFTPSAQGHVLQFISMVSTAQSSLLPSAWVAHLLSEFLLPTGRSMTSRWLLLYSSTIGIVGLAHMALHTLHSVGFSRALSRRARASRDSRSLRREKRGIVTTPVAIITKDIRLLCRDIAQTTQIFFLTGLGLLYLGNLKSFISIDTLVSDAGLNWRLAFFIIHTSITAFFTSSICTRLVYPALSLEGKSYWILQTSPISLRDVLRAKFIGWFVPVSLLSAALFSLGTHILVGRWEVTVLFGSLNFFVTFGMVATGIGLGAYFADFTWEHPSQLALSLGSFTYMLCSALLVLVNMFPMGFLLQVVLAKNTSLNHIFLASSVTCGIALLNFAIGRAALKLGERSTATTE